MGTRKGRDTERRKAADKAANPPKKSCKEDAL